MIRVEEEGVVVELEYIGEGYGGDFDPSDPADEELLRFTVSLAEPDERNPDYPEDASYCTHLPASLSEEDQRFAASAILRVVKSDVIGRRSIKRLCEDLSHFNRDDVHRIKTEVGS